MPFTTVNKSTDHFNTILNTGDGTTNKSFTGVGFQPDMIWNKIRSTTYAHWLYDAVRGAGAEKEISPNGTAAMGDNDNETYGYISSFDSDGFSVTGSSNSAYFNQNNETYVNWCWKAGTTSGISAGTITPSSYSINTSSGFGIYKYTGTGSAGTLNHGLGKTPSLIIVKSLSNTEQWRLHWKDMPNPYTTMLIFNSSAPAQSQNNGLTALSSTAVSLGPDGAYNYSGTDYIMYVFANTNGFLKAGTFIGNGSSDNFIYTGMRPTWLMFKRYSTGANANFQLVDSVRDPYNVATKALHPDITNTASTDQQVDLVSNGFNLKTTDAHWNGSGLTYCYLAFGQSLVGSNNVPCTAR